MNINNIFRALLGIKLDLKDCTWTCHVCGEERPDEKISVQNNHIKIGIEEFDCIENVRYCNDNQECAEKAKTYRH